MDTLRLSFFRPLRTVPEKISLLETSRSGIPDGVYKAYYAFYAFGQLYGMGEQCFAESDGEDVSVIAARGDGKKSLHSRERIFGGKNP